MHRFQQSLHFPNISHELLTVQSGLSFTKYVSAQLFLHFLGFGFQLTQFDNEPLAIIF